MTTRYFESVPSSSFKSQPNARLDENAAAGENLHPAIGIWCGESVYHHVDKHIPPQIRKDPT